MSVATITVNIPQGRKAGFAVPFRMRKKSRKAEGRALLYRFGCARRAARPKGGFCCTVSDAKEEPQGRRAGFAVPFRMRKKSRKAEGRALLYRFGCERRAARPKGGPCCTVSDAKEEPQGRRAGLAVPFRMRKKSRKAEGRALLYRFGCERRAARPKGGFCCTVSDAKEEPQGRRAGLAVPFRMRKKSRKAEGRALLYRFGCERRAARPKGGFCCTVSDAKKSRKAEGRALRYRPLARPNCLARGGPLLRL